MPEKVAELRDHLQVETAPHMTYAEILQRANAELGKINLTYEQMNLELRREIGVVNTVLGMGALKPGEEEADRSLSRALDKMLEAERLMAVGQITATLGHEINNPLAVILGYLELCLKRERLEELRDHLSTAKDAALRIKEIVSKVTGLGSLKTTPYVEGVEMIDLQ